MVLPTIRRWLTVVVMSLLLVTMLLPLNVLPARAQQAKQGPISIQSVWTSDENQNSKTNFAPGDKINYHADFDNNTGGQIQVNVQEEIIPNDNPWGSGFSYNNTFSIQAPSGLTRLYTPESVPPTAVSGSFSIRISVTPSDSASPANDGDWGEGNFTVKSTPDQTKELVSLVGNIVDASHTICDVLKCTPSVAVPISKLNQLSTIYNLGQAIEQGTILSQKLAALNQAITQFGRHSPQTCVAANEAFVANRNLHETLISLVPGLELIFPLPADGNPPGCR